MEDGVVEEMAKTAWMLQRNLCQNTCVIHCHHRHHHHHHGIMVVVIFVVVFVFVVVVVVVVDVVENMLLFTTVTLN